MVISARTDRELRVGWSVSKAFELVADVPRSAAHFPGLEGLDDLGDGVFRWRLGTIKLPGFGFDATYTARYLFDEAAGTVIWENVPGTGNITESGRWDVSAVAAGTRLRFGSSLAVNVDIPRLVRPVATRAAPAVISRLMGTYLDRISRTMNGRVL